MRSEPQNMVLALRTHEGGCRRPPDSLTPFSQDLDPGQPRVIDH